MLFFVAYDHRRRKWASSARSHGQRGQTEPGGPGSSTGWCSAQTPFMLSSSRGPRGSDERVCVTTGWCSAQTPLPLPRWRPPGSSTLPSSKGPSDERVARRGFVSSTWLRYAFLMLACDFYVFLRSPLPHDSSTLDRGRTPGRRDRRVARAPGGRCEAIRPALSRPVG